jgi:hypothetical protein
MPVNNKIQIGYVLPSDWVGEGIALAEQINDPSFAKYFSHAFLKIPNPFPNPTGSIIIEAILSGVAKDFWDSRSDYFRTYTGEINANVKFCLCEFVEDITDDQVKKIVDKAWTLIDRPYDFFSYPPFIIKIFAKAKYHIKNFWPWLTGKAAEKRLFCEEVVEVSVNAGIPEFYEYPNSSSPQEGFAKVREGKLKIVWKNF